MSLDMIFNECLSLNLYVCTYSQQFKLIGEGKTAKWEQDQCRYFEKYCQYQPHSAFLPLEPKILCFLPVVLCIFQKQLRPSSLTILPFIQCTGVNIGWRCGHLSREELREMIIWIDKFQQAMDLLRFKNCLPPFSDNIQKCVLECEQLHTKCWKWQGLHL